VLKNVKLIEIRECTPFKHGDWLHESILP